MALTLRAPGGADRANGQAGMTFPTDERAAYLAVLGVANRGYLARGVPSRDMTISSVAFTLSLAATNDDPIDVGIYDSTGARLVSAGATTGKVNGSPGRKTVSITPTTIRANQIYFAALSYGAVGGTAGTFIGANFGNLLVFSLYGTSFPQIGGDVKATMHPLPASWGTPTPGSAGSIAIALLEA